MKKLLLSVSTLVLCNALNAQTGNVGINTQNPTENLNVNGTFRVNELPTNGQKINTKTDGSLSNNKDQNFAPAKMVVVDNNGVFGKADMPSSGSTYTESNSIKLDGTSFKRKALEGDVTAAEDNNKVTVTKIQGKAISTTSPQNNQVLQWNGSQWAPATLPTPPVPKTYTQSNSIKLDGTSFKRKALEGDVTALEDNNNVTVTKIQGKAVSATAPANNQILQWKNNAWTPTTPTSYTGSTSIVLENNSFKRQALAGDVSAAKDNNNVTVTKIQGKAISTTAPTPNQVLQWNGSQWTPSTLDIPEVPKDPVLGTGSVIAIGGKLQIAEEITATMTDNSFDTSWYDTSKEIPHLTNVQVDNKKLFKPTTSGNTFQVSENGQYQIMMNVLIRNTGGNPVIGVWNNNTNQWVARVSNSINTTRQVYTLITVVPLTAGTTYSFRVARGQAGTQIYDTIVEGFNGGTTGKGPATFVSVKRVK